MTKTLFLAESLTVASGLAMSHPAYRAGCVSRSFPLLSSLLLSQVLSRAHVNTAVRIPRTLFPCEIFPPELHLRQTQPLTADLLAAFALMIVMNAIVLSYCFLI